MLPNNCNLSLQRNDLIKLTHYDETKKRAQGSQYVTFVSQQFYFIKMRMFDDDNPLKFISEKYSKTCLKRSLQKKTKICFQYQLSLNAGRKYCRMLQESILQYFRP